MFAIYRPEKLNQNIKILEQHFKFMNTSAILILIKAYPTIPSSGQSKSGATIPLRVFFPDLTPSVNHENTFVQWDPGAECTQLLHPWTHSHAPSSGIGSQPKIRFRDTLFSSHEIYCLDRKTMFAKFGDNILYFFLFTLREIIANTCHF
jgi:hypothetical protein